MGGRKARQIGVPERGHQDLLVIADAQQTIEVTRDRTQVGDVKSPQAFALEQQRLVVKRVASGDDRMNPRPQLGVTPIGRSHV